MLQPAPLGERPPARAVEVSNLALEQMVSQFKRKKRACAEVVSAR
jgi:hypothetical protein